MIRKATMNDLDSLHDLAENAVKDMENNRIRQWTSTYPRRQHFEQDLVNDALFVYDDGKVLGAMAFYEENDPPYKTISWLRDKSMVIHRILVDPSAQKQGIASLMLDYAVAYCKLHRYESIKIDTHPANYRMRNFLKKHYFHELDYIKVMHRIGFERIIPSETPKRIVILGAAGTGKTTLARILSQKFQLPHLHLDNVYWSKDWIAISREVFTQQVSLFMQKNERFVIDGNYTSAGTFNERLKLADTIIVLDYPLQTSLKGIIEREAEYKHRFRSDMAEGCIEKIDQEFLQFVYRFTPRKNAILAKVSAYIGQKNIYCFKNRKSLMQWINQL